MAFRFCRKMSVQDNLRRIAGEQIDKAIDEICDASRDRHDVVHQVRKRCKKLRALIRLVRPSFDDYQRENRFFRDAARELSYVRDAQSIIECLDALPRNNSAAIDDDALAAIRSDLEERRRRVAEDTVGLNEELDAFLDGMREARERVRDWTIRDSGYSAIRGGLKRTCKRGRKALRAARGSADTELLHEWRKRTKYHWYHMRLLRRIWPEMLAVHRRTADQLSDLLGDDHDLAVLRSTVQQEADRMDSLTRLQALLDLIDQRRAELQANAFPLGERLFAEPPKQLASRFQTYWKTWRRKTTS